MKRKIVLLQENIADENKQVMFQAAVPYIVEGDCIQNEENIKVELCDIWVDFQLVHQPAERC